jgi:hypothetical protein
VHSAATRLKERRVETLQQIDALSDAGGKMRTALGSIERDFLELARTAQAEADGTSGQPPLPEGLRQAVLREIQIWKTGAGLAKDMSDAFVKGFAAQKEQAAVLERAGTVLDRLEQGAARYVALARAGQQLEETMKALAEFAQALNEVLDQLEALGKKTREAMSTISSKVAAPAQPPSTPVRAATPGAYAARPATPVRTPPLQGSAYTPPNRGYAPPPVAYDQFGRPYYVQR